MKKALVLCATVPHTLLLEKLKQRGIRNIPNTLNFMKEPSNMTEQQLKIKAAIARAKGALI